MKLKLRSLIKTCFIVVFFTGLIGCKSIPSLPPINAATLNPDQIRTLKSLKKINAFPLYTMTYYGTYDETLRNNVHQALKLSPDSKRGCSTFAAITPNKKPLMARNHDYFNSPALLLFTNPPDGYKSVSIVDLSILGIGGKVKPEFNAVSEETILLYTPFIPFDGMNEYGLAVGTMYTPEARLVNDPKKDTIYSLEAIRIMLDHAQTTAEAIALLERYNIKFPVLPVHFLITDAANDTVIIEFIKDEMQIIRDPAPWQIATNFQVYGSKKTLAKHMAHFLKNGKTIGDINGKSYWRYLVAFDQLTKSAGTISTTEAMDLLEQISLAKKTREIWMTTQWSVVYNLQSGEIQVAMGRKYKEIKQFKLNMNKSAN